MPLYEYKCLSCDRHFERIERASSQHDGVCPDCGGVATRLLGAPALQFKGSGWYVNDYAKAGGGGSTDRDHGSSSPSSSTTGTTNESATPAAPKTDSAKKDTSQVA